MATQRLISQTAAGPDDDGIGAALRPRVLAEYVGQTEIVERLSIALSAVKQRGEPMDHILVHGPPGLGKTTLANVIAAEMGTRLTTTSGPALAKGTDLVAALTRLSMGDVLFIDEIHRLPAPVEEFLYSAMEDFRIDIRVDSGPHARTVQVKIKPFTLIGATTRAGLLSAPLRSRFGAVHHVRFYSAAELLSILRRSADLLTMDVSDARALEAIAHRSRGTPRIANRLLRRVRDFAQVKAGGRVTTEVVDAALSLEGVDVLGLDELDRSYLRIIAGVYQGGPVGLEAVAATMNEDTGTLEDVVEPYLLQIGYLARTRRGRMLTRPGAEHLGVPYTVPVEDESLFEP